MANVVDTSKDLSRTRLMSGRRVIKSSVKAVTQENVGEVLRKALAVHDLNRSEIDYLYSYYRGEQPIRHRRKDVRPEICNKISENRANEIVSFKVGYLCGEPIQYVSRSGGDEIVEAINTLNEYMFAEDKASQDQELVEWQMICGTAYRLALPRKNDDDGSPFELFTLDPRDSFVVYSTEIGEKPLMAVKCSRGDDSVKRYSVYTKDCYYLFEDELLKEVKPHVLGEIPIFEYPANNARLGAFEIVLSQLDAINLLESNRMDGIEQFVQAFWKFIGCKIDKELFEEFKELGAIMVPPNDSGSKIDVDLIVKELNQTQAQTLKNDLYSAVLTICGMPNRNGGSSTSDTGAAVIMRDGWTDAEARAKASENVFKRSEKKMLRLVLRICRDLGGLELKLSDIDMKFTRRNYEAIQSKSQVLISMLKEPKIHPQLAFQHSGLFTDSESAYSMSMAYYEQTKAEQQNTNEGAESDARAMETS